MNTRLHLRPKADWQPGDAPELRPHAFRANQWGRGQRCAVVIDSGADAPARRVCGRHADHPIHLSAA